MTGLNLLHSRSRVIMACALFFASVASPSFADQPTPTNPASQQTLDNVIEQYIRTHPEVIEQSLQALEAKREAEEKARQKVALANHQQDLLNDPTSPVSGNLKVFSTRLGDFENGLFAVPELADRYQTGFPQSLDGAPMLLPTRHNALRGRIDRWLESTGLRPKIVGEFEDSALLNTFGRGGLGIFPAPLVLAGQIESQLNARLLGPMSGVSEQIYAISNERRIRHPAIEVLCAASPRVKGEPGV